MKTSIKVIPAMPQEIVLRIIESIYKESYTLPNIQQAFYK